MSDCFFFTPDTLLVQHKNHSHLFNAVIQHFGFFTSMSCWYEGGGMQIMDDEVLVFRLKSGSSGTKGGEGPRPTQKFFEMNQKPVKIRTY